MQEPEPHPHDRQTSSLKIADPGFYSASSSVPASLRKVIEAASVYSIPFDEESIAALLRITIRGARIQIGKLVSFGVFRSDLPGETFDFVSRNEKAVIFNSIQHSQRVDLHHRAFLRLKKLAESNSRFVPIAIYHCIASGREVDRSTFRAAIQQSIDMTEDAVAGILLDIGSESHLTSLEQILFRIEMAFARGETRSVRNLLHRLKKVKNLDDTINLRLSWIRFQMFRDDHPSFRFRHRLMRFLSSPGRSGLTRLTGQLQLLCLFLDTRAFDSAKSLLNHLDTVKEDWKESWLVDAFSAICIRFCLKTGETDKAAELIRERLKKERIGWQRVRLADVMMQLGMLHHLNGESRKGLRTTRYALNLVEGRCRPLNEYSIRLARIKICCDLGYLQDAHLNLCQLERNMLVFPMRVRAFIVVYRYVIQSRTSGDLGEDSVMFRMVMQISRQSWSALRCLALELIIPVFCDSASDSSAIRRVFRDQLPIGLAHDNDPLIRLITQCVDPVESLSTGIKAQQLKDDMANEGDPAIDVIRACLDKTFQSRHEQTPAEMLDISSKLNHPDTRHLIIDSLLVWGYRNKVEKKRIPNASIRELFLIRALNLARQLNDAGRTRRTETFLGRLHASESSETSFENSDVEADEIDSLIKCGSITELCRFLEQIGRQFAGAQRGMIVDVSVDSSSSLHAWGDRFNLQEQKICLKNLTAMSREGVSFRYLTEDSIGSILYSTESQFVGAVFSTCAARHAVRATGSRLQRILVLIGLRWSVFQCEVCARSPARVPEHVGSPRDRLIGNSHAISDLRQKMRWIEKSDSTLHLSGETGTGKELVANIIHDTSMRKSKSFIAFNCGALPENLIESELFGHVKGAFTGAETTRTGLFVSADGGTIFLDEVAELTMSMQVKLLRVLQERRVRPLGSDRERSIDVRIISATNRSLAEEVNAGRFRADLYYRLVVLELYLPALRERSGDIPSLACHFLDRFSERTRTSFQGFSRESMDALNRYHWPGNVRELENIVEAAANYTPTGSVIQKKTIDPLLRRFNRIKEERTLSEVLAEAEKQHIMLVLTATGGNNSQAAQRLGITRQGLFKKLKRYGIINFGRRKIAFGSD